MGRPSKLTPEVTKRLTEAIRAGNYYEDEIFYDFYDAVEHKKVNGWKSQKYRGEWEDVCPECQ